MRVTNQRSIWLGTGMLWALVSGMPAVADDTELFVVDTSQFPEARPNVLFIMDTSGSMDDEISTQPTYDPATTYTGTCSTSRVYWRETSYGSASPPSCGTDNWVDLSKFVCNAALVAFQTAGFYTDRMGNYDGDPDDEHWERLDDDFHSRWVECEDDAGIHGDGVDGAKKFARNGNSSALWSSNSSDKISWGSYRLDKRYTVFAGNYLNWYHGVGSANIKKIDIVKDVANDLLDTVNGINVGLMRFNRNASSYGGDHGGSVIYAMEDIATARAALKTAIDGLPADGNTPLAETLYEAALYFRGNNVLYGDQSVPQPSVAASRTALDSSVYKTPVEYACQKNFVVYLTDGAPTQDSHANSAIESLYGSACDGNCMDEMAAYLFEKDISPDASGGLGGLQNVVTHTIGFAIDLPLLADTARRGGGEYFQANNTSELTVALSNIVADILDTQASFTSPTVSVNAFNRTQNLNDLYITVFEPSGDVHWPGNLKKYRLRVSDSAIVDANGNPAVAGSFFADTAQSFWSASVDGGRVAQGGAASNLPDPTVRNVYTCLNCTTGPTALTGAANQVNLANTALDDTLLGTATDPTRENLINFMRGSGESNGPARNALGDPLHSQPATVMYSETESIIYFATNDGYLHAIDTQTGVERWAFVPEEFLGDMVSLYHNESVTDKHYGIDGSLRAHVVADQNGTIDGSDKVYLYFGMRRGGDTYYALDITDPDTPKFLWKRATSGESWSNPVPTRMNIGDGSYASGNAEKLVLIYGDGYDAGHDQPGLPATPDDGNGITIVDAVNGAVLWQVTKGGGDMSNTSMPNMNYSFAGEIKVVDLDGDRFADRMFAADMGGQVWRFDIFNGQNRNAVVTGGMIAQLGGAPAADPAYDDVRRFYYAPDVALVRNDTHNFMHIGIGSGHRASPNSKLNHDRFYALREYNPYTSLTQAEFNTREGAPITESDLLEIRDRLDPTVPAGSAGWKMELRSIQQNVGDPVVWSGEKVLAEARTFDNKIFFTTFTPGVTASANDCTPRLGTNRLYIVDLFTGAPVNNLDGTGNEDDLTYTDRYIEFGGSIASDVVFLFPSPENPDTCVGDECTPPPVACVDLFCFPPGFMNDPIRTFWNQESIDN